MNHRILIPLAACVALVIAGCSSTTQPSNNSPYVVSFHATAPVNKDYSKTIVETHAITWYDSTQMRNLAALKFVAIGRCGCGALIDQFYMVCDSLGKPLQPTGEGGSVGFKVNGDVGESYVNGTLVVDSLIKEVSGYTIGFHGTVKIGADTVYLTGGRVIAPPAVTP